MTASDILAITILIILIILSALFSSMETAFVSCSKIKMRTFEENGNNEATLVLKILDKQSNMLTTILICNNIVNLSASALSSIMAEKFFGSVGVTVATGVLTFLILIFGEISPKTFATVHADRMALKMSHLLKWLMIILAPIVFCVGTVSRVVLKLLKTDPNNIDNTITEDELRVIVDASHEDGVLEKEETEMIKNVVDFGDSFAKKIMIPRADMVFIQVNATWSELMDIFRNNMFTRMPVYDESEDNIVGILNMKDAILHESDQDFIIESCMREPFFTIETKSASNLMDEMRKNGETIAIVVDEYGATSGMITMEDLLEEIVGEIRDEYDDAEKEQVKKNSESEYIIDASMKLSDINNWLNLRLESEEYDSLGGYILEKLDHIPEEKEEIIIEDMIFTVIEIDKNRIVKVKLNLLKR